MGRPEIQKSASRLNLITYLSNADKFIDMIVIGNYFGINFSEINLPTPVTARIIRKGSAGIVNLVLEKNIVWMSVIDIAGRISSNGILLDSDFIYP